MEDDKGLELSLGLYLGGGSSSQSKIKDAQPSSDPKVDEGSSSNRLGGGNNANSDPTFKNFFTENHDQKGKQTNNVDSQQHEKNFWNIGSKSSNEDVQNQISQFKRYHELWSSNNKATYTEDDKLNKRKMPFDDDSLQNKHKVVDYEDSSSAVANNEDAAESEAEGSNSCIDVPKFTDKESSISGNVHSNQEIGKVAYGIPLSIQPVTMMTNAAGFPSSACVMQLMPAGNNERPNVQAMNMNASSLQFSFGYSPVQLPTLETGSSWAFNSQPRNVTSHVNRDGAASTENSADGKLSHVPIQAPRSIDLAKINENNGGEIGSSQNEAISSRQNATVNQPSAPSVSLIKPGILSEVKFGGSGSYPDLPWVSTTGPGPNGKTISGVTYKYNQHEVKIVCACHGNHMSPEEFVRHASGDSSNQENNANLAPNPSSNPAASAKS